MTRALRVRQFVFAVGTSAAIVLASCGGAKPARTTSAVAPSPSPTPAPGPAQPEPTSAPVPSVPPAAASKPPAVAARELWSVATPGQMASLIGVADGKVYVLAGQYLEFGSPTRHVLALDAETGKQLWSHDAGEAFMGSGALQPGAVVLTPHEGKAFALDAATGKRLKKLPAKAAVAVAPALACTAQAGQVVCTDAATGAARWQVPVLEAVGRIEQSEAMVCFARAKILAVDCVDAGSGAPLWSYTVARVANAMEPDAIHFDLRVVGSRLLVANYDGKVTAAAAPQ